MTSDGDGDNEAEIIRPSPALKQKAEASPKLDVDALEKADQVIADLADDYLEWVGEDLQSIQGHFDALAAGEGDQKEHLDEIFRISHDMKGQGGSFGFDLITVIGNHLCRFLETLGGRAADEDVEVIKVHIDAMRLVISQKMKGDGGKAGERLVKGLEAATRKVTDNRK